MLEVALVSLRRRWARRIRWANSRAKCTRATRPPPPAAISAQPAGGETAATERARELIQSAAARLTASGRPDPEADALWLVSDALRVPRGALALRLDDEVDGEALRWFRRALERRAGGEPLQYVEGFAFFYGRAFRVDPRVLIPRGDTEILAQEALARLRPGDRVLDLCTGSGVLAVTLRSGSPAPG
jgi:release factor glutamine methyltransferase